MQPQLPTALEALASKLQKSAVEWASRIVLWNLCSTTTTTSRGHFKTLNS